MPLAAVVDRAAAYEALGREGCGPSSPPAGRVAGEGEFEEYHSSADNLDFVRPESLEEALEALIEILAMLEVDRRYVNLMPKGEPQLGKRGSTDRGGSAAQEEQLAMLWVLNQSTEDVRCLTSRSDRECRSRHFAEAP